MYQYPYEVLESDIWKFTTPDKNATEIKLPDLRTYTSPYLNLNEAGNAADCTAFTDGGTTTNSKNTRAEFREMKPGGKDPAAWSFAKGVHQMLYEISLDAHPLGERQDVVAGQIHGKKDDRCVFRFRVDPKTGIISLWITDDNKVDGYKVVDNYQLGAPVRLGFKVEGGVIRFYCSETWLDYTQTKKDEGAYFKIGSYPQARGIVTPLADGSPDFGRISIYAVQVCHDGVCYGRLFGDAPAPQPPPPLDIPKVKAIAAKLRSNLDELESLL